jgi:hypothetical protein
MILEMGITFLKRSISLGDNAAYQQQHQTGRCRPENQKETRPAPSNILGSMKGAVE